MFEIKLFICIKMDLALNNLQKLISHKSQTNKQTNYFWSINVTILPFLYMEIITTFKKLLFCILINIIIVLFSYYQIEFLHLKSRKKLNRFSYILIMRKSLKIQMVITYAWRPPSAANKLSIKSHPIYRIYIIINCKLMKESTL